LTTEDCGAPLATFAIETWRVERWASLSSTNDRARTLAVGGEPGRQWILADEQRAGRGRQNRVWSSPPGNLYASALILDPCPIEIAAEIGFVAGVAAHRAVEDLGVADVKLKWPNDLVCGGAKLAGLIVEGVTTPARRFAAIMGVGMNVASSPQNLAYPTTSLAKLAGGEIAVRKLFERLASRFDEALAIWGRGAEFFNIREAWLAAAAGVGGPIRVSNAKGAREGKFRGLDARGRLLLERGGAVEIVESADLTLISAAACGTEGAPQKDAHHESRA
jgi:BirA family biotin operon repressor/biotin-[acetyl-CoA-carboxylase] ligase